MDETRALKDKLDELDKAAAAPRRAVAPISCPRSQPHPRRSPHRLSEADNKVVKHWGEQKNSTSSPSLIGRSAIPRHSRSRNARPNSPARALPSTWALEPASSRASSLHVDMHTRSTATKKSAGPSWSIQIPLRHTASCLKFAEDLFRCSDADADAAARGEFKDNDHWLIPTPKFRHQSYRDEILDERGCPSRSQPIPVLPAPSGRRCKDTAASFASISFRKLNW